MMCGMKSLMSPPTNLPVLNRSLTTGSNTACSYTHVDLAQGTRAWHDWRKQGIGASDAASIMGESPFKNLSAVLAEKLTDVVDLGQNARMALGVALEPNARRDYCEMFEVNVEPACVQSVEHPWMRASLDGLSSDGGKVLEIKCGRAAYWTTAKKGKPPAYYVAQLQHILAVTALPRIDFVCHFPPLWPICLTIERDDEYIARLIEKESAFWTLVQVLRQKDDVPMHEAA
jgi:putative phage-type endonuclease